MLVRLRTQLLPHLSKEIPQIEKSKIISTTCMKKS